MPEGKKKEKTSCYSPQGKRKGFTAPCPLPRTVEEKRKTKRVKVMKKRPSFIQQRRKEKAAGEREQGRVSLSPQCKGERKEK